MTQKITYNLGVFNISWLCLVLMVLHLTQPVIRQMQNTGEGGFQMCFLVATLVWWIGSHSEKFGDLSVLSVQQQQPDRKKHVPHLIGNSELIYSL